MAAIAGLVELSGGLDVPSAAVLAMTEALAHRGPDGDAVHLEAGLGLGYRHLGRGGDPDRQTTLRPGATEGGTVVFCQGQLLDAGALRRELIGRGRSPRCAAPAELIAHLWEEHGVGLFDRLRGGFAFALWDARRRCLLLGRDRFGIAPLYWTRQGDRLLFASEIKGLLASGHVRPEADPMGLEHCFTFLGLPTARTCFRGVCALRPGHYLLAEACRDGEAVVVERQYWDLDFPDRGQEERGGSLEGRAGELDQALRAAVARRLEGDLPLAAYVSGGIDCSTLLAIAGSVRQAPLPSYTVRLEPPGHDESGRALRAARAGGSEPVVLSCGRREIGDAYPRLIHAAESPVTDASAATLLLLAERARADGYRAVLAGDGADDLFAGYPWFKADRLMGLLDWLPGVKVSQLIRRAYLRITSPMVPWANVKRIHGIVGGHHAWLDLYGLVARGKFLFYSDRMRELLGGRFAYDDLKFDTARMQRWHPLNRGLYFGLKMHVPGLLLQAKGDRLAAHSGVQLRHPFLDEEVVALAAGLHPDWKLRRLRDKYVLRGVAQKYLPRDIAWRPKADFVAPFDTLFGLGAPGYVEELLSEESLRRTGYFDAAAVRGWLGELTSGNLRRGMWLSVALGLTGVAATQLWHHTFLGGNLASLPAAAGPDAGADMSELSVVTAATGQAIKSMSDEELDREIERLDRAILTAASATLYPTRPTIDPAAKHRLTATGERWS